MAVDLAVDAMLSCELVSSLGETKEGASLWLGRRASGEGVGKEAEAEDRQIMVQPRQGLLRPRPLRSLHTHGSTHVVTFLHAPLNGWCTSHRMHDSVRDSCLFGCAGSSDSLGHHVRCIDLSASRTFPVWATPLSEG